MLRFASGFLLAGFALGLLAGTAQAHNGEGFPHVNPLTWTLAANETRRVEIQFNEGNGSGDFEMGALFILSIVAPANGSLDVSLHAGHDEANGILVANWTVCCSGQTLAVGTRLPADGRYTLWVRNPGSAVATTSFFYDQSCNCAGKPIPAEVERGTVVFNADAHRQGWLRATIFEPAALHATIRVGTLAPNGTWPQDFREIARSEAGSPVPGATSRAHQFNLTTQPGVRYYFLAQGLRVDRDLIDLRSPADSLMLTPLYEEGQAAKSTPEGPELAFLALAGAAVAVARSAPPP